MEYTISGKLVSGDKQQSLGNLVVEAFYRYQGQIVQTDRVRTGVAGDFKLQFSDTLFVNVSSAQAVEVFFQVYQEQRLLPSRGNIPILQAKNQEVSIELTPGNVPNDTRRVHGVITWVSGKPATAVTVRAFDRDMRTEQLLGQARSDTKGSYEISYVPEQFLRAEKENADLFVRVHDDNDVRLGESRIVFNAETDTTINVVVDMPVAAKLSEYEELIEELTPLVENVAFADLTENGKLDDIRFLHGETRRDARLIDFLATAHRFALQTKIAPDVFYGLLRQSLPRELKALLAEKPAQWLKALKASITANRIPLANEKKLDAILADLKRAALTIALEDSKPGDPAGLGQIARIAGLENTEAEKFVAFSLRYEDKDSGASGFWEALDKTGDFAPETVHSLQFTTTANVLAFGHAPTLEAMQSIRRKDGHWKNDLARMTRDDWRRLTEESGHPSTFADSATFAETIADEVERSYPTAVVAARLVSDREIGGSDLRRFFVRNPDFDLLHGNVDDFLERSADLDGIEDRSGTRTSLLTLQRTMRIAPEIGRFDVMSALIRSGYTSLFPILMDGEREFRSTMVPIVGERRTEETFLAARARADLLLISGLRIRDRITDPLVSISPLPAPDADAVPATLANLFGSLNGCQCEHCRSMYSPAAYLVDMLQHLKEAPTSAVLSEDHPRLLDTLFRQRPDIPQILLSCANSNTPLPYIDLVNEILEDAVAETTTLDRLRYQTLEPVAGESQSEFEARLRAIPQHELPEATARLLSAKYPWNLPFDPALERVWLLARHLGLDLAELQRLFRQDAAEAVRTELQLSEADWRLLTDEVRTDDDVAALWGARLPADSRMSLFEALESETPNITHAAKFLIRSGLDAESLRVLTETRFLSVEGLGEVTLAHPDDSDPCEFDNYSLNGLEIAAGRLDAHVLDQIQRFLRITRKLRISIVELDAILAVFNHQKIGEEALKDIARVRRLAGLYRCSIQTLANLTGPALAAFLMQTEAETATFAALTRPADLASLSLPAQRLSLLEHWIAFRETGMDLRELAYILLGRDQVPPAFEPGDENLKEFLLGVRGLVTEFMNEMDPSTAEEERIASRSQLIVDNLAAYLSIDRDLCSRLVQSTPEGGDALLDAEDDAARPAIDVLLHMDLTDPAAYDSPLRLLRRLDRIARLLRRLGITAPELSAMSATRAENGFLDLDQIRAPFTARPQDLYSGWMSLSEAKRTQKELPRGDNDLFDLMRMAADADVSDGDFLATLRAATGWNMDPATGEDLRDPVSGDAIDVVDVLSHAMEIDRAALRCAGSYARLNRAVQALRRWRVQSATLAQWADPACTSLELADRLESTARSRQPSAAAWYKILTPMMDDLRERKRDALLAYLIQNHQFENAAAVYEYFLIDPEMSSCMQTTRIVQANASVQLFVQRLLLNLDPDLRPDHDVAEEWQAHWRRWDWMSRYRVWEANRKVLLYPENWLLPELRDDKSPFFAELENALLQDEMNADTVERAYRKYLVKLRDVGRLDVRAFYVEEESQIHVFARTFTEPHTYFYRRRNLATKVWTAWEKIDLNIEGDHLMPIVFQGQLLLLWAKLVDSTDHVGDTDQDKAWDLSIAMSAYRGGRWQAPRTSSPKFRVPKFFTGRVVSLATRDLTFRFDENPEDARLQLRLYLQHPSLTLLEESYAWRVSASFAVRSFTFDSCNDTFREDPPAIQTRMLLHLKKTYASGTTFVEEQEGLGIDERIGPLILHAGNPDRDSIELTWDEVRSLFDSTLPIPDVGRIERAVDDGIGNLLAQIVPHRVLDQTPGIFSVVPGHQYGQFTTEQPFFFQDADHCFFVTFDPDGGSLALDRSEHVGGLLLPLELRPFVESTAGFRFEVFYHPFVCAMIERFSEQGFDGLLAPPSNSSGGPDLFDRQNTPRTEPLIEYGPHDVLSPHPVETISFDSADAYGGYNWELFFHVPLLIATRLSQNQRFEDARRWFHYIFDPTDTSLYPPPARFWRVKPFFELASAPPETLAQLLRRIAGGDEESIRQVDAWRDDPFDPHAIARLRHVAYMKQVVMGYLDNLIAWADDLFGQDTRESINEAAQLYLLAGELLGPRTVRLAAPELTSYSYAELTSGSSRIDDLSNAWLELESYVDSGASARLVSDGAPRLIPYFCIPSNDKLMGYWDKVADRLFKIRHCMDIEGRIRELPLFEPPIDPALLVRARAAGIDLRSLLRSRADSPRYRFAAVLGKAIEFCGEVRALGSALLAALEKRDAEALALLRSRHEISLLQQTSAMKDNQISEARESLESQRKSRLLAEKRQEFYSTRTDRNSAEDAQVDALHIAHGFEIASQIIKSGAPLAYSIPNFTAGFGTAEVTYGGTHFGSAVNAAADAIGIFASQYSFEATMSSLTGGYDRRRDDWQLQAELANREIAQIDRQITAAEIRLAIAEQDRENHRRQFEQAQEVEEYLRGKFTNDQLYDWMAAQLSSLHYQSYQAARDLALKAQAAANQELGRRPEDSLAIIGVGGHWDAGRKGMLAGERLHGELRRLDAQFMESNERRFEITKHVSLATLDPGSLIRLKATGKCEFSLPEWLFDLDYPGHYNRRIKSVGVTIPCVTGPYTNVSCTLKLTDNQVRYRNDWSSTGLEPGPAGIRSIIATSNAQNDSGIFELNFRDERYLPFEGAGVNSTWEIRLGGKWLVEGIVVDWSSFDFDTISDVMLSVSYTALDGFETGTAAALANLRNMLAVVTDDGKTPLARSFSLRHEFPSQWNMLIDPPGVASAQVTAFPMTRERFPLLVQRKYIAISEIRIYLLIHPDYAGTELSLRFGRARAGTLETLTLNATDGGVKQGTYRPTPSSAEPAEWELSLALSEGTGRVPSQAIREIMVICHYTVND